MAAMVEDWHADVVEHGAASTRMLAARRTDVATLNELARAQVAADGSLTGPTLEIGGRHYQAGDRVVSTRNDRRFARLRNSHTGTITDVDVAARTVTMRRDRDGRAITLDETYARRHLDHAYATTIHKSQGATYAANTRIYVDLDGATLAEHGYVGLSRSAQQSHLYLARDQMAAHVAAWVYADDRRDPLVRLAEQLSQSAIAPLASDSGRPIASEHTRDLVVRREQIAAVLRTIPPDVSDRIAQADQALAAARTAATQPNATRGVIERAQTLKTQHAQLLTQAHERRRWLDRHGPLVAEYQEIAGELAARAERRAGSLPFDRAALQILGEPPSPDAPDDLTNAWRAAAREYVTIEQRHGTVDLSEPHATRQLRNRLRELQQVRQPQQTPPPMLRR